MHHTSSGGPSSRRLLIWGVIGVIAQVAFMVGWLIAETWQGPGYSSLKYTISDMLAITAPHAWFPIACFVVGGLGTFGFAVFGLRPALSGAGKVAAYSPWMMACSALALGNFYPRLPCRLADPGCTAHFQFYSAGGMTDAIVSSIAFFVLAVTPFPLWQRLAQLPEWSRLKPVMMAARVIGPACLVLLVAAVGVGSMEGLMERLLATSCFLWMGALAVALVVHSRHALLSHANTG